MNGQQQTKMMSKTLVVIAMAVSCCFIGDLHANAAEPPVEQKKAKNKVITGEISPAKDLKSPGLMSVEEVYTGMLQAEQARASAARVDPAVDNAVLAEKWGIQVISVSYAADGFWLAFRFRVVDPAKANVLFDTRINPYLEAEANGIKLGVPTAAKIGSLRTTNRGHNIKAGKIYNIMFSNPGFGVRPGEKVAIGAGDFKVEHLTVRGAQEHLSVNESALGKSDDK